MHGNSNIIYNYFLNISIPPTVFNVSKHALHAYYFIIFLTTAAYLVLLSLDLGMSWIRLLD